MEYTSYFTWLHLRINFYQRIVIDDGSYLEVLKFCSRYTQLAMMVLIFFRSTFGILKRIVLCSNLRMNFLIPKITKVSIKWLSQITVWLNSYLKRVTCLHSSKVLLELPSRVACFNSFIRCCWNYVITSFTCCLLQLVYKLLL